MFAARKKHPTLTLVAGPNGSGKSTIVEGLAEVANLGVVVNADQIAASFAKRKGEPSPSRETQWEAAISAENMRWALLSQGISFVAETVMSDFERWARFLTEARRLGYRIVLYFVTTIDPAINVARVGERVLAGGHAVAEDKIRSRYRKVMDVSLPGVLNLVDEAIFFDNSSARHGAIAVATMSHCQIVPLVPDHQLPSWARALTPPRD